MKALATLVRLHRQELDTRRRRLVALERARAELDARDAALVAEREAEARFAATSDAARAAFPAFATAIAARRQAVAEEAAALDRAIAEMSDAVAEAFRTLKRFEIARDERARQAALATARREQAAFDELAGQRWQRGR